MTVLNSQLQPGSETFESNRAAMQAVVDDLHATLARTALGGSEAARANISTVAAANEVIQKVNVALDAVATSRANMGAAMNRLQHVVDNLTNVSMNEEASRSQIEDADYAAASTELARTQIMQQAATAVLAQANTDMQTVMKLLQ